ncbi:MAG: hypothetical protein HC908_01600 [Calothrix sp. SM1_7_51]|nr:hypothetical protein [Calothrix sp. SM1_7_51]
MQLRHPSERTTFCLATNFLYRVGLIPLHGEMRTLQLQALESKVQGMRNKVKAIGHHQAFGGNSSEADETEVDFSTIDVEAD